MGGVREEGLPRHAARSCAFSLSTWRWPIPGVSSRWSNADHTDDVVVPAIAIAHMSQAEWSPDLSSCSRPNWLAAMRLFRISRQTFSLVSLE